MTRKKTKEGVQVKSAGKILQKYRKFRAISIRTLEEKTEINRGTLSHYENDVIGIPADTLKVISDALDIPSALVMLEIIQNNNPDLANPKSKKGKLLRELSGELKKDFGLPKDL
jgi:transcriptional regulator with XRE-family HTH domain